MSSAPKYKRLYRGNFASIVFKSAGIYTGIGILLLIGFIFLEGLVSGLFLIFIVPPALIPPITLLIIPISVFLLEPNTQIKKKKLEKENIQTEKRENRNNLEYFSETSSVYAKSLSDKNDDKNIKDWTYYNNH